MLKARKKAVAELRAAAREAGTVFLAADPDREGEAICWHLAETLGGPAARYRRVAFHEVTPRAVREAFDAPRAIDARRVDAQQTRRVVDRLVGYSLSPLLWRTVRPGLSAGRVQSVALRLVCDRERERSAFRPEEHWAVRVHLDSGTPPVFPAVLVRVGALDADLRTAAAAEAVRGALEASRYRVGGVERRERRREAPPPFVTATLQQEAFRRLRFPVKKTMQVAQRLYEGVELPGAGPVGLITYMRTDSVRVSPEAAAAAREHVARVHGPAFVPEAPNAFRSSSSAQDAHEAIRPTDLARSPASLRALLPKDELALYTLVFERFVASQMAAAVYDETIVDVEARPKDAPDSAAPAHGLRARDSLLRFRGFLAASGEDPDEPAEDATAARRRAASEADRPVALPPLVPGSAARLRARRDRAALHRAAAALHRGEPREGAREARHRPALDVRDDPRDARRTRLRDEGEGPPRADPARLHRDRPPRRALPGAAQRALHGVPRGRARRDRGGTRDAPRCARDVLAGVRARARGRRRAPPRGGRPRGRRGERRPCHRAVRRHEGSACGGAGAAVRASGRGGGAATRAGAGRPRARHLPRRAAAPSRAGPAATGRSSRAAATPRAATW